MLSNSKLRKLQIKHSFPHCISAFFALLGIFAYNKNSLWLMILSAVVAFAARWFGFLAPSLLVRTTKLRKLFQSSVFLIIFTIGSFFLVRHLWNPEFFPALCLSLNGSILLLYTLDLLSIINLSYIFDKIEFNLALLSRGKLLDHIREENHDKQEEKAALDAALKAAGLKKNQVEDVRIRFIPYSSEAWNKFYYEDINRILEDQDGYNNKKSFTYVTFRRGDKAYSYKHYYD